MLVPHIVLIVSDEDARMEFIRRLDSMACLHFAGSGLDGFAAVRRYQPAIVIIDNDLPDIQGMSVASILKDSSQEHALVYLLNILHLCQDVKADRFFPKPYSVESVCVKVSEDLQSVFDMAVRSDELQAAVDIQNGLLPPPIRNSHCAVDRIFSPYRLLSGDGLCYWYVNSGGVTRLYGFVYDCTGHELSSYLQTSSLYGWLKKAVHHYQIGVFSSLSSAMEDVNHDVIELYGDNTIMAAAIMFCFDFSKEVLHFCSAAIPELFYRSRGEETYISRQLHSPLLGYDFSSKFSEEAMPLADLSHIIFATDGLSDLLFLPGKVEEERVNIDSAKPDDCTAVFVDLCK